MTEREAMTLERQAFEEWHNRFYGTVGVRSLEWRGEIGYLDETVQAQFTLFQDLSRVAEPVAWLIDVPFIPDCPAWASEFPSPRTDYRSRPLYLQPPEPARDARDSARLDALEADIAKHGPITLHNGEGIKACQRGLGMANTGRTLRDAIDGMTGSAAAMAQESGE